MAKPRFVPKLVWDFFTGRKRQPAAENPNEAAVPTVPSLNPMILGPGKVVIVDEEPVTLATLLVSAPHVSEERPPTESVPQAAQPAPEGQRPKLSFVYKYIGGRNTVAVASILSLTALSSYITRNQWLPSVKDTVRPALVRVEDFFVRNGLHTDKMESRYNTRQIIAEIERREAERLRQEAERLRLIVEAERKEINRQNLVLHKIQEVRDTSYEEFAAKNYDEKQRSEFIRDLKPLITEAKNKILELRRKERTLDGEIKEGVTYYKTISPYNGLVYLVPQEEYQRNKIDWIPNYHSGNSTRNISKKRYY
jgi:hypothetical protein